MAYPQVVTEATSSTDSNSVSQIVSYPSSMVSGNLLVCVLGIDGAVTVTWPAGWTEFLDQNRTGVSITAGWRIINGTEGSTFTVTSSATEQSVAHIWQISGHDSGTAPEALSANSNSDLPDPPSLTPTGGSKDYLWIACAAIQDGTNTASGFPSGYSNTGQSAGGAAAGQAPLAWGRRESTATSEDPSIFTTTGSSNWMALTIAVYPTAGISGTVSPNAAGMTV